MLNLYTKDWGFKMNGRESLNAEHRFERLEDSTNTLFCQPESATLDTLGLTFRVFVIPTCNLHFARR